MEALQSLHIPAKHKMELLKRPKQVSVCSATSEYWSSLHGTEPNGMQHYKKLNITIFPDLVFHDQEGIGLVDTKRVSYNNHNVATAGVLFHISPLLVTVLYMKW